MRGPDIQGAGGKGLHSGLLTFKPQREAGWTAHSPPWLRLRRSEEGALLVSLNPLTSSGVKS